MFLDRFGDSVLVEHDLATINLGRTVHTLERGGVQRGFRSELKCIENQSREGLECRVAIYVII
jgi:hypothetical protein